MNKIYTYFKVEIFNILYRFFVGLIFMFMSFLFFIMIAKVDFVPPVVIEFFEYF